MEPKKISDLLPNVIKPNYNGEVEQVQQNKLERFNQTEKFMKTFGTLTIPQKFNAVSNQVKGLRKTYDTVTLLGRVLARDEPKVLYLMVEELFNFAGINDANLARTVTDILIESYGWMALQDYSLFFRKIKAGNYGEVYGKMNGMWVTGKMQNFQQSVAYNLAVDREAEHFARKKQDGCTDLDHYYDDVLPEIIE